MQVRAPIHKRIDYYEPSGSEEEMETDSTDSDDSWGIISDSDSKVDSSGSEIETRQVRRRNRPRPPIEDNSSDSESESEIVAVPRNRARNRRRIVIEHGSETESGSEIEVPLKHRRNRRRHTPIEESSESESEIEIHVQENSNNSQPIVSIDDPASQNDDNGGCCRDGRVEAMEFEEGTTADNEDSDVATDSDNNKDDVSSNSDDDDEIPIPYLLGPDELHLHPNHHNMTAAEQGYVELELWQRFLFTEFMQRNVPLQCKSLL